jgi:predicted ATP-grasp superfamily ATP-dependent carboligase
MNYIQGIASAVSLITSGTMITIFIFNIAAVPCMANLNNQFIFALALFPIIGENTLAKG